MKAEIKRILATYIEADVGATITGFEKASEEIAKSYEDYAEKKAIGFWYWIQEMDKPTFDSIQLESDNENWDIIAYQKYKDES